MLLRGWEVVVMKKHYLVLGAGGMGFEIAYDLLKKRTTKNVHVIDADEGRLEDFEFDIGKLVGDDMRLTTEVADATDKTYLAKIARDSNVIFSTLPYFLNMPVTEVAIEQGKILCDLGGNPDITNQQHELDEKAAYHKARIFPACGIAPGAASIVAMDGINRCGGPENTDFMHVYSGGLPVNPQGILNYKEVFYIEGWFNEIRGECEVVEDFKLKLAEPMSDLEYIEFPEPYGGLQAVHNSGGIGRTAMNLEGRTRDVWYKTLRYPGHWEIMKSLNDLGFLDKEKLACGVSPAEVSEELISRHIRYESEDVMLLRWNLGAIPKDGMQKLVQYNVIQNAHRPTGRTAMQIMTSDSTTAVGLIAESGAIERYGVISQDEVPPKKFLRQWSMRGINWWRREEMVRVRE
jgi:lysine 6-dehydrogenase